MAAAAVGCATYAGWRLFWFLTDDAYIAFRYASNSLRGYGWVWNPPPFAPVEGYTSFLWLLLLDGAWRLTGQPPPVTANGISLVLGYGQLALVAGFVARMTLPAELAPARVALGALVMLGIVANRTFLAWLSSGLETSLFNFCLLWWLYVALTPRDRRGRRWLLALSTSAALLALARPDGLLFCGATAVLIALAAVERRTELRHLLAAAPLLLVPMHLLWRHTTYGAWLPNTYYAKYSLPWPESGLRYLLSFALEYALWIWLVLAAVWIAREIRSAPERGLGALRDKLYAMVAIGAVFAHVAYYTLVVGGDHFEYRVYSQLVPLSFVSLIFFTARLGLGRRSVFAVVGAAVLLSWPIPWMHWLETRHLETRRETLMLVKPVAPLFPSWLRHAVQPWDDNQRWLIRRWVGARHQEHKAFMLYQEEVLPSRAALERAAWGENPVLASRSVGYLGWILPDVAIIDELGLNDRVVARNETAPADSRLMAHDREPPAGYVACFRPNVVLDRKAVRLVPRADLLRDEEIVACERRFEAVVGLRDRPGVAGR